MNNVQRAIMTHTREVYVIHTITNKVFITIPLYFEKQMIFQSARIECGELIIEGKLKSNLKTLPSPIPSEPPQPFSYLL